MMKIPERGLDRDTLFARLQEYRAADLDSSRGTTFGYVYDPGMNWEDCDYWDYLP